jgi:homoserine kinase
MQSITVKAPGTIANLVCAFDIMGLALNEPFDEMTITLLNVPEVHIKHTDKFGLPEAPQQNVAGVALLALMQAHPNKSIGFQVSIHKNIKPGSGLGSSAASAAGAVVAANILLNNYFTKQQLVAFAMCGEELASGVKHADNIAPCIYGGVTLVRSTFPLDIISLSAPELYIAIVHPQIEIKTSDARKILRTDVPLKDAITQWGNIAGLVAGFLQKDYSLISRSLVDVIIEPTRSILIPGFYDIKQNCSAIGVLGGGISGSGPSIFMLCKTAEVAGLAASQMEIVYNSLNIPHHIHTAQLNNTGVSILNQ